MFQTKLALFLTSEQRNFRRAVVDRGSVQASTLAQIHQIELTAGAPMPNDLFLVFVGMENLSRSKICLWLQKCAHHPDDNERE